MFEPDSLSLRLLYKPLFRLVDGVLGVCAAGVFT